MSRLVMRMNEMGLYKSEDGKWGIRQVAPRHWAIQYRGNPDDPWDWSILTYRPNYQEAMTEILRLRQEDKEKE